MMKILTIIGARPQFIKAAAISRRIQAGYQNSINEILVNTGQHYDPGMSDVFFEEMGIPVPLYNLEIGSGNHGSQTGGMLKALEEVLIKEKPDGIIVYGDTNSTIAAALAASKLMIPVIHIEAGLRSFNKSMPEEINRISTDHVSTLLFSPTSSGIKNLKNEGLVHSQGEPYTIDNPGIFHCGDIMYDNTVFFRNKGEDIVHVLDKYNIPDKEYILGTIHRPQNTDSDERLEQILKAFIKIVDSSDVNVILPLHPRTTDKLKTFKNLSLLNELKASERIYLIPPVSFLEMIRLEDNSRAILTDSGGVQKEAWFLKKPVVILRAETEWVEITESGNGRLTDASTNDIVSAVQYYLGNPPQEFPAIYGDGNAADSILKILMTTQWR